VTGSTGFVGSHLVRHLAGAGWTIAALARSTVAHGDVPVAARFGYGGATQDVCRAVKEFRPDVVFHLASLFLVQHGAEDVEALIDSNVLLGTQLLEGMRLANVTALVNAGTGWQSFRGPGYEPANLYAATKQAFEDIVAYYVSAAGLRCITLRLFDSYGPGDKRRKLLRLMLDALRTGVELDMSPGDQVIDLAHVDDVCRAFIRAGEMLLQQREPGAAVYAVSGGERRSLREVAAVLEKAAGKTLPLRFGARPHREREVMVPWNGPALPGWEPKVSLLEGFKRLLQKERSL